MAAMEEDEQEYEHGRARVGSSRVAHPAGVPLRGLWGGGLVKLGFYPAGEAVSPLNEPPQGREEPAGQEGQPRASEAAAEEGQPSEDDEGSEPEELKRVDACRKPTRKQIEEHEDENHSVFREWCEVCLASRGTGAPHRRRKDAAREEEEGPRIMSDYFFMNDNEQSMPMLAMKFSRSKRIGATALQFKGVTEYGVKAFARFIQSTGVRSFVNCSDGEPRDESSQRYGSQIGAGCREHFQGGPCRRPCTER